MIDSLSLLNNRDPRSIGLIDSARVRVTGGKGASVNTCPTGPGEKFHLPMRRESCFQFVAVAAADRPSHWNGGGSRSVLHMFSALSLSFLLLHYFFVYVCK